MFGSVRASLVVWTGLADAARKLAYNLGEETWTPRSDPEVASMIPRQTAVARPEDRDTSSGYAGANPLPAWTWIAPLFLFQICTWGSLRLEVSPGVLVWYLPLPVGIVLVHWWGPRVLAALIANAMITVPLWDLPWRWAPVQALPETATIALSWLLFSRLARGQCQLPDVRQTANFAALGVLVPVVVGGLLVQTQRLLMGELPAEQFWPAVVGSWTGDMLGCLAIAVPALMFLTAPLRRRGWAGLSDEAGRASRYLFIRGRPWSFGVLIAALGGITIASAVIEPSFVMAGYAPFVLAAALSGGAGAAVLTGSVAMLLTLPIRAALIDGFPAWWAAQATPFAVNLQLLVLCMAALITGRAISDLTSETDRRRQSEARQRDSELRFRDFAGAASDLFWETGPDLRFTWISANPDQLAGIFRSRPLGKTPWEFEGADPRDPEWAANVADMEARRPFRDFRYSTRTDVGDDIWLSISGVPVFDDTGAFGGYRGTATNVTPQTVAEQAFAESKALLDMAVESIADGFALYDSDDRLVLSNARYRDAMSDLGEALKPGMRFEDLIRRAVEGGLVLVPPDVDPEDWVADRLREHRTPGAIRSFWTADGRWIEVREYPAGDGYLALLRVDATERKRMEEALRESESRLRDAQRNAHLGTWEWDIETGEETWSEELNRIMGFDPPQAKPKFRTFLRALHPDDRRPAIHAMRNALEDDAPYEMEYRIMRPDGSLRIVESRGVVQRDPDGHPFRMSGTVFDITDRKLAEEQLRHARSQKAIGDLASGIAHEINNLLQPIMTLTNLARNQFSPGDPVYDDLGVVVSASERARDLVKQVLAYSRPDRSAMSVGPIAEIVAAPLEFLRATVPSTVDLGLQIDQEAGNVDADPAQISTLLINLVSNAVDALEGRTGRITIGLAGVQVSRDMAKTIAGLDPGRYATISVADTGCGMDESTLRRMFDPFFTTKPVGEGTGLGLAAVQGIVDAHGGAVEVNSAPGEGTTIDIYFPLAPVGPKEPGRTDPA